ncbi:hypothetical protein D9611_009044 [Ephemerocybe angulata]|uniref:Uncharacterized protein n=1 Tax=Ephemerocybe angulata TaxID=980116 RepID=A0A8H5FKA1_9AGAR|nr:hypothetical protein D9611_009044 [Tulosesus angulatus]
MLTLLKCDSWLASCPHTAGLLRALWRLASLTIEGDGLLDWESLPNRLQRRLYKSMARRDLEWLSLASISNFDILPVSRFFHINNLCLHFVSLAPRSSSTHGACFPLTRLPDTSSIADSPILPSDFDVMGCGDALRTLLVCAGTSSEGNLPPYLQPKTLCIGTTVHDEDMKAASELLETLDFFNVDPSPSKALFKFSRFPRLVDLIVQVKCHDFNAGDHPILPLLLRGVEDMGNSRERVPLKSLTIQFDLQMVTPSFSGLAGALEEFRKLPCVTFWVALDKVLAQSMFPSLEAVEVTFDLTGNHLLEEAAEACTSLLLHRMKNLGERRGIVKLVVSRLE